MRILIFVINLKVYANMRSLLAMMVPQSISLLLVYLQADQVDL